MFSDRESSLGSISSTMNLGLVMSREDADRAACSRSFSGIAHLPPYSSSNLSTFSENPATASAAHGVMKSSPSPSPPSDVFVHNPYSFGVDFSWGNGNAEKEVEESNVRDGDVSQFDPLPVLTDIPMLWHNSNPCFGLDNTQTAVNPTPAPSQEFGEANYYSIQPSHESCITTQPGDVPQSNNSHSVSLQSEETTLVELMFELLNILNPLDNDCTSTVASVFESLPFCKNDHVFSKLAQFLYAKAMSSVAHLHFWARVCSQFYECLPLRKRIFTRIEFLRLITRTLGMTLSQAHCAKESQIRQLRLAASTFCGLLFNYGILSQREVHDKVLEPMLRRGKLLFLSKEACFSIQCSLLLLRVVYKIADSQTDGYVDKVLFDLLSVAPQLDEQLHQDVVQFVVRREEEHSLISKMPPHA